MLFMDLVETSIAVDSCHLGGLYRPVLHQHLSLHSILSLADSWCFFVAPTNVCTYVASYFTPGLYCYKHESFLGAEVREHAWSGLCWLQILALGRPNYYLRVLYSLVLPHRSIREDWRTLTATYAPASTGLRSSDMRLSKIK